MDLEPIVASLLDLDRIAQPFSRFDRQAARIAGSVDLDRPQLGPDGIAIDAVLGLIVGRSVVGIGDAFAAEVEIAEFDRGDRGNREGRAEERCRRSLRITFDDDESDRFGPCPATEILGGDDELEGAAHRIG